MIETAISHSVDVLIAKTNATIHAININEHPHPAIFLVIFIILFCYRNLKNKNKNKFLLLGFFLSSRFCSADCYLSVVVSRSIIDKSFFPNYIGCRYYFSHIILDRLPPLALLAQELLALALAITRPILFGLILLAIGLSLLMPGVVLV